MPKAIQVNKYELSTRGFAAFSSHLYEGTEASLSEHANAVARDVLGWLFSNFELQVHQVESLRALPQETLRILGWCTAAAIASKVQLVFSSEESMGQAENRHLAPRVYFLFSFAGKITEGVPVADPTSAFSLSVDFK